MEKEIISSLDELHIVIKALDDTIKSKDIIVLLQGTLASGKTTLVKEYVKHLGLDDDVTSPTFSIQSLYGEDIFHYDTYNKTLEEFIAIGLLEEFEKSGIHFVEWGDEKLKNILDQYGFENITIKIEKEDKRRRYVIQS